MAIDSITAELNPTREAPSIRRPSDVDLETRITASLRQQPIPSLRKVVVEAADGTVVLRGEVNSFYAKQVSQHSARQLAGENCVVDEVSVVTPAAFRDPLRLRRSIAGALLLLLLAALSAGCSEERSSSVPVHPVSGQVTLNGRPAARAVVVFHPKDKAGEFPFPTAVADANGKFQLSTYKPTDGAPVGEYVITVELRPFVLKDGDYEPGPNQVNPKYSKASTSNLLIRVAEGTNQVPVKVVR